MKRALKLARQAERLGEVPIGAVLVKEGKIIGEGHNFPIGQNDPTAHAEIQAIRQAAALQKNYRLPGTTLYVTLEPCSMCAGALVHSRVKRLIYGATDEKTGACGSVFDVISSNKKNHQVLCEHGLLASESVKLLSNFFTKCRAEKEFRKIPNGS